MGYTHYYRANRPLDGEERTELGNVIGLILGATDIPLGDAFGEGKVEFVDGRVTLNGVGDDGHETFCFPVGEDFNFCKTACKPYDEVVTAILIAADAVCHGAFSISSDGNVEDWSDGLRLACAALGRSDLRVPLSDY